MCQKLIVVTTMAQPAETDGRHARGERTRKALAEALLTLLDEGHIRPTAQQIAQRAGVSLRILFHHFTDINTIFSTVADLQFARIVPTLRPIGPEGPVEERLRLFVRQRSRVLESIAPVRRAAMLVEPFSETVAERLRSVREAKRDAVTNIFTHEIQTFPAEQQAEVIAALAAATSFSAWEELRTHQKLPISQARRALARTVAGLIGLAPDRIPFDGLHDGDE